MPGPSAPADVTLAGLGDDPHPVLAGCGLVPAAIEESLRFEPAAAAGRGLHLYVPN